MDRTSLRWGLLLGAVGAAIGTLSLLVWPRLGPAQGGTVSSIQQVLVMDIWIVLRLIFLAVVLGIAYYGGYRIERERAPTPGTAADQRRTDAVLAGGLILALDWVAQTIFLYAAGTLGQRGPILPFIGSQLIFGVICVLSGAGIAGLGARDQAARRALAHLDGPAAAATQTARAAPADGEGNVVAASE